tara:strand:- start:2247 stop:2471 length:225 start_codon:yes stop_codon:yes gene_type:complete
MERAMFVKEGHIVIDLNELCGAPSEYNIPLDKCKTSEQILGWVLHLAEKTWADGRVIRRFIAMAAGEAGIEIQH